MGGTLHRPGVSDVILLIEKDDDRIVLVEQMWKYKHDISKYIGVKHAFIVTTTMKGQKTKRDLIINKKNKSSERVCAYESRPHHDYFWKRVKVDPEVTEKELQERLDVMNKQYCVTENNCWHYSNTVMDVLKGRPDPHPYHQWMTFTHKLISPIVAYKDFKAFNKRMTEFMFT